MAGRKARRRVDTSAALEVVKVTVRLPAEVARRLGVASAMSRETRSAIVARVLGAHLSGWRLPSNLGPGQVGLIGTVRPDEPDEPAGSEPGRAAG
jgi:uncharacterized MAPEG superfamily protein